MFRAVFFFIFLTATLFGEEKSFSYQECFNSDKENISMISIDGMPNAIVGGCVNAISGDYFDFQSDLVMQGSEPLVLERSYSSSNQSCSFLSYGWNPTLQGLVRWTNKKGRTSRLS